MNKKGEFEDILKIILWVIFFMLASYGLVRLVRYITS